MSKNETKDREEVTILGTKIAVPPMRQIILETDGTNIRIVKSEASGKIEFIAILQAVIGFLNQPPQK